MRWLGCIAIASCFCLASCGDSSPIRSAERWPEADLLFQRDPRWIGGDGAYSCDLGKDRVLWLFGDSLIAKDASRSREKSWFIRNSIAIQRGYDPTNAMIGFSWGTRDGHPGSFFPEDGSAWFWPGACMRTGKVLVIFGQWLVKSGAGQFGFHASGTAAFVVDNPDDEPAAWHAVDAHPPAQGDALILGTAGFATAEYIYAYGGIGPTHDYALARFATADAQKADLSHGEFYTAGQWSAATAVPSPIFANGAPESSVYFEPKRSEYLMFQSEGFGATTLAVRSAPAPEGPWSAPHSFIRPPESYEEGAFVYAGKAHPELAGADAVVTYVPSRLEDDPRPSPDDYYYPHFVKVHF